MQVTKHNIEHDGDLWQLAGVGIVSDDGEQVFAHLASLTRGEQQRNGWVPKQINDWIPYPVAADALRTLIEDAKANNQPYLAHRLDNDLTYIGTRG